MSYLIIEIGTGLVDGYYMGSKGAEGMREFWDKARPKYNHLLVQVIEGGQVYLPDRMMMNRQPEWSASLKDGLKAGHAKSRGMTDRELPF